MKTWKKIPRLKESEDSPPPYIRKVMHTGTTRLLSLGKVIPKDWNYVKIHVDYEDAGNIYLYLERMWNNKDDTQDNVSDKTDKQDAQEVR